MKRFTLIMFIVACIVGWTGVAFADDLFTFKLEAGSFEEDMSADGFDWNITAYNPDGTVAYKDSGSDDENQPDGILNTERVSGDFGILLGGVNPYITVGLMKAELTDFDKMPAGLWEDIGFESGKNTPYFGGGIIIPIVKGKYFALSCWAEGYKAKVKDLEVTMNGVDFTEAVVSGYAFPDSYEAEMEITHMEAGLEGKAWFFEKTFLRGLAIKGNVCYSATEVEVDLEEYYTYPSGNSMDSNIDFAWDKKTFLPGIGIEYPMFGGAVSVDFNKEGVSGGFVLLF
jgi:hypothetical protein